VEFKLNNLRGLFGGRRELPLLHGVLASLNEQRMAASHARALHAAVAGDDDFDLDLAPTFIRLARSGYAEATLVLTLRLVSSVEPVCANPEAPEKMSTAVAASANFFHLLVLIDTIPPRIGRCPVNGRHVKCQGGEAYQLAD